VVINKVLFTISLILALISCGQDAEQSYNGISLPTPQPIGGFPEQPPPAWLIIDGKAIPATYGSFCIRGACADMVPPQLRNDLVSVPVPSTAPITVIIQAPSITEFYARVGAWRPEPTAPFDPTATRARVAVQKSDGSITAFTLEPIGNTSDQLLAVSITFESGDASYLWRLNPAQ
jgi:hypothetical protein